MPRRKSSLAFFQQQQHQGEADTESSVSSAPSFSEVKKRKSFSEIQKVADKTPTKRIKKSDKTMSEKKRKPDVKMDMRRQEGKLWKDHVECDYRSGGFKKSKQSFFQAPSPSKSVEKFLQTPRHLCKMTFVS